MEKDGQKNVVNHFAAGSNCQVFNGNITGCVFAMPGSTVTQQPPTENDNLHQQGASAAPVGREGNPTFFVHPSVDADEAWQIHDEIARLATCQGIQEICKYLSQLSEAKKVLLPQNAEKAYNELVRLGMPHGEGYSLKTFTKYYKR